MWISRAAGSIFCFIKADWILNSVSLSSSSLSCKMGTVMPILRIGIMEEQILFPVPLTGSEKTAYDSKYLLTCIWYRGTISHHFFKQISRRCWNKIIDIVTSTWTFTSMPIWSECSETRHQERYEPKDNPPHQIQWNSEGLLDEQD